MECSHSTWFGGRIRYFWLIARASVEKVTRRRTHWRRWREGVPQEVAGEPQCLQIGLQRTEWAGTVLRVSNRMKSWSAGHVLRKGTIKQTCGRRENEWQGGGPEKTGGYSEVQGHCAVKERKCERDERQSWTWDTVVGQAATLGDQCWWPQRWPDLYSGLQPAEEFRGDEGE